MTIDGRFDGYESVTNLLTPELKALLDADEIDVFNAAVYAAMADNTGMRWYIEHGLWCFRVPTPYDFFVRARPYTLEGVVQQITCPVPVCVAADDHLNPGQAEKLAASLADRATLRSFTAAIRRCTLPPRRVAAPERRRLGLAGWNVRRPECR